jgi:hypothetical protein
MEHIGEKHSKEITDLLAGDDGYIDSVAISLDLHVEFSGVWDRSALG